MLLVGFLCIKFKIHFRHMVSRSDVYLLLQHNLNVYCTLQQEVANVTLMTLGFRALDLNVRANVNCLDTI